MTRATGAVRSQDQAASRASVTAAALFIALATFEASLAAGFPLGKAAWGGAQANLGPGLRVASGVSAVLLSGAALVVLRRGGGRVWAPLPDRLLPRAVWVLAAYTGLGALLNAASRSGIERAVMTPTALSLAALCVIVAVRGSRTPAPTHVRID